MTLSAVEVNQLKQAPAADRVLPAILHRWSPRAFADKPVSDADLKTIFQAVRWTASSSNEQPWRFLVGRQGSETYKKIFDSLMEGNKVWAAHAPVLILSVAHGLTERKTTNGAAMYDLGQASAMLVLQATALGLSAHQMGGYERDKARAAFGIPEEYHMGIAIALGYQGEPASLTVERLLQAETSPRSRKELNEFVLSGWGEAAHLG
jgi:nitroreductase